jgi:hypothetical protein
MTTSLRTSADEANVGNARCQVSARTTDKRSGCKQRGGSSICEHNLSLAHDTTFTWPTHFYFRAVSRMVLKTALLEVFFYDML